MIGARAGPGVPNFGPALGRHAIIYIKNLSNYCNRYIVRFGTDVPSWRTIFLHEVLTLRTRTIARSKALDVVYGF